MCHSYYVLMDLQEVEQLWRSLVLFDKNTFEQCWSTEEC